MYRTHRKQGSLLILTLVFGAIAGVILAGLVQWVGSNVRSVRNTANREIAFQIAEAGLEYYRWHLAHNPNDFEDGTENPGPYTHDFKDVSGSTIGQFVLTITSPAVGSTKVIVRSEGRVTAAPTAKRVLEATLAMPSIAKYAVVTNTNLRIGEGTEVFGPVQANGGILFNGLAHNIVSSASTTYPDPDYGGSIQHGVYTRVSPVDPQPPTAVRNRPDVFQAGRTFPVPPVLFSSMADDLSNLKSEAKAGGRYFASSTAKGYHVVLKTNDTFDLYKVTATVPPPSGCTNLLGQASWDTWGIQSKTLLNTYPFPANGLLFLEDHVWVDGQIDGARLTIIAANVPEVANKARNIILTNNLLYTNYDGSDAIGLIAEDHVLTSMYSVNNLRIDAALIAKNGRAGRLYYRPASSPGLPRCAPYDVRASLTLYGMLASNTRYGFSYTNGTGYITRDLIYDANMLYAPPPSIPLVSDEYVVLSWRETK